MLRMQIFADDGMYFYGWVEATPPRLKKANEVAFDSY